jgi:hypothetical protein
VPRERLTSFPHYFCLLEKPFAGSMEEKNNKEKQSQDNARVNAPPDSSEVEFSRG